MIKGFDTSRHNHEMVDPHPEGLPFNFDDAYADEYRIWAGRASVGDYYIDPWFQRDFDAAGKAGFIRLAYLVPHPELPVLPQFNKFLEALDGRKPDGIIVDMEVSGGQSAEVFTKCYFDINDLLVTVVDGDWNRLLCYTNWNYGTYYLLATDDLDLIIANPGKDNGMNYASKPSIPELWDEWLGWQKDWKHAVPGVPDPTVDYAEYNMDEETARYRFAVSTPPNTGDENMSEILDKLDLILDNQGLILYKLDHLNTTPTPEPTPTPIPEPTPEPLPLPYYVKITDDKANMRFQIVDNNGKVQFDKEGKPIFEIYPSDSSLVKDRIQFVKGAVIQVSKEKVTTSGGETFYPLKNKFGRDGEKLYVWTKECMKLW